MTEEFPDDGTGDALRRIQSGGDSLQQARDVDFSVVFPDEKSAILFCERIHEDGLRLKYRKSDVDEDRPWDVTVVRNMVPTYADICAMEDHIESIAEALNGKNDGWGCFSIDDMPSK